MEKIFKSCGADQLSKHHYGNVYTKVLIDNKPSRILVLGGVGIAKACKKMCPDAIVHIAGKNIDRADCSNCGLVPTEIGIDKLGVSYSGMYFDLIIDDYTHSPNDYLKAFDHLKNRLVTGGYYVVEDIRSDEDASELSRQGFCVYNYVKEYGRWDDRIAVYKETDGIIPSPRKINAVTPTGDREDSFKELIICMNKQHIKPDNWIIVDDGRTPMSKDMLSTIEVPYTYIRETPMSEHSLSRNMRTALQHITEGDIIIIEDDEWYGQDYIQQRSSELDSVCLTGDLYRYRYSLSNGGTWGISRNSRFSCLHSTAFRSDILPVVKKAIGTSNRHDVDVRIWDAVKNENTIPYMLYHNTKPYMVTLKAWPNGRAGTMNLHRRPLGNKDSECSKLMEWVGEDANRYSKYIHYNESNEVFEKIDYGFWKQVNPEKIDYSEEYKKSQSTDSCMSWLRLGYLISSIGIPVSEYSKWSVCDVGCGNGEFARNARKVFGAVKEYDVCPDSGITEEELYNTDWDCVFLTDVLEHYDNIYDLFKLKSKYIFLSFPECPETDDFNSLKSWRHYKPNEHIYMLNAKGVCEWLAHNGYKIIAQGNPEDAIRKSPYAVNISTIIAEKV